MTRWKIGNAPKRREDERFVTGNATYLDDYSLPGMVHAVVLRSPHAHAIIERLDEAVARIPGVLAVLTATDVKRDGLGPLWPTAEANLKTGEPFAFMPQPLLATNKVRYVGEPVALIIAESHNLALHAAEMVAVDYAPLTAVSTSLLHMHLNRLLRGDNTGQEGVICDFLARLYQAESRRQSSG